MGPGRELQGLEPRARRGLQGWMGDKRSRDLRAKETYTEARFLMPVFTAVAISSTKTQAQQRGCSLELEKFSWT